MSRPDPLNLVHESETQRQHVRVRIPGELEIQSPQGAARRFRLHDLSAGGLSFEAPATHLRIGSTASGRLRLRIEGVEVAIPVRFEVRHTDPVEGRVGVRFEALGAAQTATLRRVIGAYLSGELLEAGDVIHTLARNNFTPPRKHTEPPRRRGFLSRTRALAQTAAVLVIGAIALLYVGHRLHEKMFGSSSIAARVSGPSFQVEMPRDGVFHSLVPADGIVKKGSPLGSFETSMFGLVQSRALEANLSQAEIDALLGTDIKGTVTSPCDCRVVALHAADGQYVSKGRKLAKLTPVEFEPYVVARFGYREAGRLEPGTVVSVRINGEALPRSGRVTQLRHEGEPDSLSQDMVVVVEPETVLPMDLLSRPARVSAAAKSWLSSESLSAMLGMRAEAQQ